MNTPTVALIVYEQMMPIHFAMAYSVFFYVGFKRQAVI